ncbi:MAG: porin family protein [Desulfobacterales bacterium]|nr:porin family protein [Desulfobacterales bacterium]MBI5895193.1 porin family protein [Desulfobacterales bacterium]
MKKVTALVFCLVLLSNAGTASAGKETGPYIGGSLGWSAIDVSSDDVNDDYDDEDLGYKIFGGYNFGVIPLLDLAIEGSYVDFGKASSSQINQDVEITGWDLFGLAALNLGPVGVFGKVGQIWWDRDSNSSQIEDSGNDMAYGIGLRFQIGSFGIRGEYEYFDLEKTDVGMLSAGVSWTF